MSEEKIEAVIVEARKAVSWPHVAALAVLVTGAVLIALFSPEEVRVPFAGLLVALAGWLRVRS